MNRREVLAGAASRSATAALDPARAGFKPTQPVEAVVHTGPGGGSDVLARAVALMLEKEKLLPVRMQVVNKPGGGARRRSLSRGEEGRPEHHRLLHRRVAHRAAGAGGGDTTPERPDADRAPRARARGDRGQGRRAEQEPPGFHRGGEGKARRAEAVGRLGHEPRQHRAAAPAEEHRRAVGVHLVPGGGERIAALLGGHVNMMVIEPAEAGEHIRAGKLRVLAQVTDKRLPASPTCRR